jgi:hypothetical protein
MLEVLHFDDAIAKTELGKRHIVLGNGFSIACRPDIFLYKKLFERANFKELPRAKQVFDALDTNDFERVIRALRDFVEIAPIYYPNGPKGRSRAQNDADQLRELLVRTISNNHPTRPGDISSGEYAQCKNFLSLFKHIYTLNYDLLLYWTLMQEEISPLVACDDGFRKPEDDLDASYVTWEPDNTYDQNVHYLHGALHLFDSGADLQKYTWSGTGVALIDQIRDAMEKNKYPLFVAEGSSTEKMTRIKHSDYLAKAYRSLLNIRGSLFIHGHSLAENDEHVLRAIEHNTVGQLFVSVFGDLNGVANKHIIRRANAMPGRRRSKRSPLEVHFYSAETAAIWKE